MRKPFVFPELNARVASHIKGNNKMKLSVKDVQDRLDAIVVNISNKGWRDARAYVQVESGGRFFCNAAGQPITSTHGERFSTSTFGDTFDQCLEYLEAMDIPDLDEMAKDDFIKSLAALIDTGNKIGVDIEFMNPLTAAMKLLSENIITHERG